MKTFIERCGLISAAIRKSYLCLSGYEGYFSSSGLDLNTLEEELKAYPFVIKFYGLEYFLIRVPTYKPEPQTTNQMFSSKEIKWYI